jgi:hypothetical protein
MSSHKKKAKVQQSQSQASSAYNGEVVEAQVIGPDDYVGQTDEYGQKQMAMDPRAASNDSRSNRPQPAAASASSYGYAGSSSAPPAPSRPVQAAAQVSALVEASSYTFKQWPAKLRGMIIDSFTRPVDERRAKELMSQHHWPAGLQAGLIRSCQKFPMRYFVIDDSGSMSTNDGRRPAGVGNQAK